MIDKLIIEYVKEYKKEVFSLFFIVSTYEKGWDKNVKEPMVINSSLTF